MAAHNQYKTTAGGAWTNIPAEAITGTVQGGPIVVWPQPSGLTPTGEPCAAVGLPSVRIHSTWMRAAGVKWWFDRAAAGESVEFWISAFDPRANDWRQFKGKLVKPVVPESGVVLAAALTYYTDVTIIINEVETA